MHLKITPQTKIIALITVVFLVFSPLFMAQASTVSTAQAQAPTTHLTTTSEYTNYVHNFVNAEGNCTYVEKPMFPVLINDSQIPIGENWTIICPLQADHNYHIYCYGTWINTPSKATTDYNFYVYDPQGNLISSHIEAAGLPPNLGTTVNDPLFTPTQSGNYSFVIANNPYVSKGAQEATFMIIENLACNTWYTSYVEGINDGIPSFSTNWAYEFVTNASYVELYVNVPETMSMYEARLYLMNNAGSPSLDSYPLPWEQGLYGNLNGTVGGYNFEPNGYVGVAYASGECMGQKMSLNYTSPNTGTNLYQLVLMGEVGSGNITFMLKSNFDATLTPSTIPSLVNPNTPTEIIYSSNDANLDTAELLYTIDNWKTTDTLNMDISNQTCNATIPGQIAGTFVQYRIKALDVLENNIEASGNYTVKEQLTLKITAAKDEIRLGENFTINGVLTPNDNNYTVEVTFNSPNSTQTINCPVSGDSTFVASFKPNSLGSWAVIATCPETQTSNSAYSQQIILTVIPPPLYVKYELFIVAGLFAAMAAGGVIYFLKFRGK